ncbi:hypothetical protein [Kingella negevensis]|uniref:Lipoprotein n=1 Tax=Kingella negevensis TaxID=1522312 RepID=A0A238HHE6_9NEIS|nr:hypothetical protein [Kingella negevensis]SNB76036.1 Uncharacterised protein [Kingella negevensis]
MKAKLLFISLAVMGLSACSSVAQQQAQSPKDWYVLSLQRQFKEDSQYNFQGTAKLELGKASEAVREKMLNQKALHFSDDETQPENAKKKAEKDETTSLILMNHFENSLSIPYSGAVDLPHGKAEMAVEFRYQTRQSMVSARLPMQLNLKDKTLVVDAAAVSSFLDVYVADKTDGQLIQDKLLRFSVPEKLKPTFPLDDIMAAFSKAVVDGYRSLKDSDYSELPLDETAKKLGASHRVLLTMKSRTDKYALQPVMAMSLSKQMAEMAKQPNVPEEKVKVLELWSKAFALVAKQEQPTKLEKNIAANSGLSNIPTLNELYLARNGRLLASRTTVELPAKLMDSITYGRPLKLVSFMELKYTKQPTFMLKPTAENTVEAEKVFPAITKEFEDFDLTKSLDNLNKVLENKE